MPEIVMGGTYYGKENEYDVSAWCDDYRKRSRDSGTGRGGESLPFVVQGRRKGMFRTV